jgi:lipopolysaccharide export system permease protein
MVLCILTGLAWMIQILTTLKYIVQYGIGIWGFLGLSAMMIPFIVSIIMPFVLFVTALFVYNKMIGDSEMTACAATGMSPWRVARPAVVLGAVLTAVHLVLAVVIIPPTQGKFYDTQWEMRYGLAHLKLQESVFTKMANGLVVYVSGVADHDLSDLMLSDTRNKNQETVIMARRGKLINTDSGISILMDNGSVQVMGNVSAIGTFDTYSMDMNLETATNNYLTRVRRLPSGDMARQLMANNRHENSSLLSEAANRFLMPIMDMVLLLICLVALLRGSMLRRGVSLAAPIAVTGMAAAMVLFMMSAKIITTSWGLAVILGGEILMISALLFALIKEKK